MACGCDEGGGEGGREAWAWNAKDGASSVVNSSAFGTSASALASASGRSWVLDVAAGVASVPLAGVFGRGRFRNKWPFFHR